MNGIVLLLGSFLLMVMIKIPVAYALGLSSMLVCVQLGVPLTSAISSMYDAVSNFSLLAVPLSMVIGSDALYMICAPIFAELSIHYGGSAIAAAASCTIGACIAANLCLVAPTPYLALGLAGVEMKDNLKTCFVPIWILGIVLAIVGAIAGAYPF